MSESVSEFESVFVFVFESVSEGVFVFELPQNTDSPSIRKAWPSFAVLTSPAMPLRGPFLSGALGSIASLQAILRWAKAGAGDPVVVLGPLWLGVTLAAELRVLMLVATDDHAAVKRARRRALKAGRVFESRSAAPRCRCARAPSAPWWSRTPPAWTRSPPRAGSRRWCLACARVGG